MSNLDFAAQELWISFKSFTSDFQLEIRGSHGNLLYDVKIPFSYKIILENGENQEKGWPS